MAESVGEFGYLSGCAVFGRGLYMTGGTGSGRRAALSWVAGAGGWSGGLGQGAEPLPAGQEDVLTGPGPAEHEDTLPGVAGQPGGQVQEPEGKVTGSASLRSSWAGGTPVRGVHRGLAMTADGGARRGVGRLGRVGALDGPLV
jgi:hypothetical protein